MKAVGITCLLLASMPLSFGASKEMIELQRDVAQLQDQVRNLQKKIQQIENDFDTCLEQLMAANTKLEEKEKALQNVSHK